MDNLDKKIQSIVKQKIMESSNYTYTIENTLHNLKDAKTMDIIKNISIVKYITAIFTMIIVTTGIVFAKDISHYVKNFFNNNNGIDNVINNGYIENVNMQYINSNGTNVKIENLLMDDYNLNFNSKIKLNDTIKVNKILDINFEDVIISDENNRILYCNNKNSFEDYCNKNNLKYEFLAFNNNYINAGINDYIKSIDNPNNEISIIYNLSTDKFPKSKLLNINLKNIVIRTSNDENLTLVGNWQIEVDIPEKFYNRKNVIYNVKESNNPSIKVTEATVYNTGMQFSFYTKINSVYDEDDSEVVRKQKIDEYVKKYQESFINGKGNVSEELDYHVHDEYVINSNGQKFYPSKSNSENEFTHYAFSGEVTHSQTFDINKYTMTDELELHFVFKGKETIIKLSRK